MCEKPLMAERVRLKFGQGISIGSSCLALAKSNEFSRFVVGKRLPDHNVQLVVLNLMRILISISEAFAFSQALTESLYPRAKITTLRMCSEHKLLSPRTQICLGHLSGYFLKELRSINVRMLPALEF